MLAKPFSLCGDLLDGPIGRLGGAVEPSVKRAAKSALSCARASPTTALPFIFDASDDDDALATDRAGGAADDNPLETFESSFEEPQRDFDALRDLSGKATDDLC